MDSIADAVLVVDRDRTLVDLNAAALRLAGSPAEWRGRPADALFPFLAGAPIAGAGASPELTVTAGPAVYDVRVSRARAERAVWIVMLRDISAPRRAAEEREQFLVQNNELVSRVTHELRTPVAAIQGALELVRDRAAGALGADEQRLLDTALNSCERLARIVRELLDLSTIDAGRPPGRLQPLAVERLIVDALLDVGRAAAAKKIRLDTAVAHGLPLVLGDHDRLVQVLVQLVANAITHGPEGSHVTLSAWPADTRSERAVVIGVRDEGPGIAPAQAEAVLHGTGLAIVKALVEQHGGRVALESVPGAGATFLVSLPQAPAPRSAPLPPAEPAPGPAHVPRILVADDDQDLREVVTEALQAQGFEVVEAGDGRAAIEALAREPLDLAVLDITMPHYNGYEVIRALRGGTRQPALPVLVLTGSLEQRDPPPGLAADVLLTKPANLRQIVAEVKRLLGTRRRAR